MGVDYEKSVNYANAFYQWLKINHPEINFAYFFGYSMEHPQLFEAIEFMQKTNSPGGEFLQLDGLKKRTTNELESFLVKLKNSGIKLINLTFYGTEEFHDTFAGRKGDFTLMVNTLNIAHDIGLNVEVGIPALKNNVNQLEELVKLLSVNETPVRIFTPHSGGKGKNLINQKITIDDYNLLSEQVKMRFNRNNNRTQFEWFLNPPEEVTARTLVISLLASNFDDLQKQSFEQTIKHLESLDENYYSAVPSFQALLAKYCDKNDNRLYTKKDLYNIYRNKFIQENNLKIVDITDERFSGSIRY